MLWLALHLPWLALEALGPAPPPADGGDRPARAVVDRHRLCVVNAVAKAAGLGPGMSVASALALLPGLQLLPREPAREDAFVRLLAIAMGAYTPQLVTAPDAVLLEVSGSLRLFGGLRGLGLQMRRTLQRLGVRVRIGIAPTPGAALLFARLGGGPGGRPGRARSIAAAQGLLDALPLMPVMASLGLPERLAELMQGIGCQRVGEARALPRTGLQRRGGGPLLQALDRAYGDAPDPQPWFEPPRQFELSCELLHRADDAAMVVFAAQRLVQPLAGWLSRQWLAASRCTLWLLHERSRRQPQPPTPVRLAMGQPTRDAAQLIGLLRERLQRTALPSPVYGLRLQLDDAVALAGHDGRLMLHTGADGAALDDDPQAWAALVDRLSARLGPERVQRLALREDHRPERAAQALPAQGGAPPAAAPAPVAAPAPPGEPGFATRPGWLLAEPLPLAEHANRPVHGGPLVLRTRPERIEAGWFDGEPVCRDYHVAEGRDHRLRWVYRERRGAATHWYLHGLFG